MTERLQSWILHNTKGMQYLVNERLAKRGGPIGRVFSLLEMGKRQYGQHSLGRFMRLANYWWLMIYQTIGMQRAVFSRFIGVHNAPLNYSGLFAWFVATNMIFSRFRFIRARDVLNFNQQDQPEFWYARYGMMFPPSFLHNRLSAHYIEINHIFCIEMMKKYIGVRKEIIEDREKYTPEERLTRYAMNPNYIYEPMGPDCDAIAREKAAGTM